MKNKIYLVYYSVGDVGSYHKREIFVTHSKKTAIAYKNKFNRLLKKWGDHYKQYEGRYAGMAWLKDEYVDKHCKNWNRLRNLNRCDYKEIEVR